MAKNYVMNVKSLLSLLSGDIRFLTALGQDIATTSQFATHRNDKSDITFKLK